jgi:starch synthase (maltosyl-transferring)
VKENFTFTEVGRRRVAVENVIPEIDAGRFAIKRTIGESVVVEADIFADGHDSLSAVLKFRAGKDSGWSETPMIFLANDRWRCEFIVTQLGNYFYTIEAWVDQFKTWQADFSKKLEAGQNVSVELQTGAKLIETAAQRAMARDAENLRAWAKELTFGESAIGNPTRHYLARHLSTSYEKELRVTVDPELARFSAWYEMFPRSFGNLKGCAEQLPRVAKMGFDVLYLPPIHPIGKSFRKGKNNKTECAPGEPGSPWAIGSSEGGHKSIHPELGTLEDFKNLVARAKEFTRPSL